MPLEAFFSETASGTVLGFFDLFSGGNFSRMTIFALGIMPYITASIILQLLTVVWPYLEKLSKEGELGRRKDHDIHQVPDDCGWLRFSPAVSLMRCSGTANSCSTRDSDSF